MLVLIVVTWEDNRKEDIIFWTSPFNFLTAYYCLSS